MSDFMQSTADAYTRAIFGAHAVKCPLNLIAQPPDKDRFAGVAQSMMPNHPLLFGRREEHLLILGDCVFRPHLIVTSKHLLGAGIGGIYRSGFDMAQWVDSGTVLFNAKAGGWMK